MLPCLGLYQLKGMVSLQRRGPFWLGNGRGGTRKNRSMSATRQLVSQHRNPSQEWHTCFWVAESPVLGFYGTLSEVVN